MKQAEYGIWDVVILDGNIHLIRCVMAGLVPAIHDFDLIMISKSWMPDMKSGMTALVSRLEWRQNKKIERFGVSSFARNALKANTMPSRLQK